MATSSPPIWRCQVGGEVAARLMRGERVTLPAVLGGGASATGDAPGPGDLLASLGMATHSNANTFGEMDPGIKAHEIVFMKLSVQGICISFLYALPLRVCTRSSSY